ncbi:MAG: hypothetical protein NXI01_01790 [Gammaproteobacteria bacterium]|nr:hypothetical protein [Gammaproteobacteria bacterium]
MDFILTLAGILAAPLALLIGLLWLIPAYALALPYLGKPQFFLDAALWFGDSIISIAQYLLFPIHAYNASGSMEARKEECTRIVETH